MALFKCTVRDGQAPRCVAALGQALRSSKVEGHFLIRVYGDSLSMPRHSEGVRYFETYPFLIQTQRQESYPADRATVYNRSFADASSTALLSTYRSDAFYFGPVAGDIGILQCGIVDCAPRPIPPKLRSIVSRLPASVRQAVVSFLHRNRARMLRTGLIWRVTLPDPFVAAITEMIADMSAKLARVYVINIAPTTLAVEARSPGLSESIRKYNQLLESAVSILNAPNVKMIDVHTIISSQEEPMEEFITPLDGHHISVRAHRLYAEAIMEYERPSWSAMSSVE